MTVNVLNLFKNRGYFFQCTDEIALSKLLEKKKINLYIGFDCTAKSLHVGSLLQIMCLRQLQKLGHTPVVLLGGGTTLIGDPSGKEESRKILSEKEIEKNVKSIKKVFASFLSTKGKNKVIFVNNKNWLKKLNYIQFLRDYGKHFTINKMLTFDSVKLRLEREQSLSFLEFNYMIFQAYDFMKLYEAHKCLLQIGGSDQWGNIVNGVELIRRSKSKEAYGLTTPLITTSSGSKMGKTEKGAIWLDKSLLSPFDYWQFWRNTDDNDVINYLKLFTEISDTEITKLSLLDGSNINEAKIILANAATEMLHGKKEAEKAYKTSQKTFNEKSFDKNLPTLEIKKDHFVKGVSLKETLIKIGFATSNSDYKRNFKNLAYKINNSVVKNENEIISTNNLNENIVKISFGKKKHYLIKII
ncbi:MAG: tyrosine--tRNA ligase [Pelagibacteraceae bacterium TMED136]|nr:MAG: tyrosine--tRNA ligase [Pelagibacteraceae bacterium TMED136]|tara:strand:- start:12009 stop:13247 length:1239 start_codon:yes stop_codon:yes gene_type:complete